MDISDKLQSNSTSYPVVLILSGKRKSGKDYVAALLQQKFGVDRCVILRLSGPLKGQYAKAHSLDFGRLLDSSEYKEKYRSDMIQWGEDIRNQDPGYFCRLATASVEARDKCVWIISDARRPTDIQYFRTNYSNSTFSVRIICNDDVRKKRGFVFTKGVDDADSECALDSMQDWNFCITNEGDSELFDEKLTEIVEFVKHLLISKK